MKQSFIDMSTWAHEYLIESRVAMVSLYHQKVTPVMHDVVAFVDMHHMAVALAVALVALVFLSGTLTYKLFKIKKANKYLSSKANSCARDANFWHEAWMKTRERAWSAEESAENSRDIIVAQGEVIESQTSEIFDLTSERDRLEVSVAKLSDKVEELEEEVESLEEQLEDANSEANGYAKRAWDAEAANEDLHEKVENLTSVVLRAA